jgi:hypothetical protein
VVLAKTELGYKGTISDAVGVMDKDTPLSQIKLDGDKLTFQFPLTDGAIVAASLKIEGDKMAGAWTHQEGSTGLLAFERKK